MASGPNVSSEAAPPGETTNTVTIEPVTSHTDYDGTSDLPHDQTRGAEEAAASYHNGVGDPHHGQQQQQQREEERQNYQPDHRLSTENQALVAKIAQLTTQLSSQDLELQKLTKIKAAFADFQTKALSSIDRFQPEFDESITESHFKVLEQKCRPLVSFLTKLKTSLSPRDWAAEVGRLMWEDSFSEKERGPDFFEDRGVRRKVLRSVVWTVLEGGLFHRPFLAFGGELAKRADDMYKGLFPEPKFNDDSAKWRTMTVQQLKESGVEKHNGEVSDYLVGEFATPLHNLGYDVSDADLRRKLADVLAKAIPFAQLLAGQRAIFELFAPDFAQYGSRKKKSDGLRTNVDAEDPDETEEVEGEVRFLVRPGLVKWGSGMGEKLDRSTMLVKSYVELM